MLILLLFSFVVGLIFYQKLIKPHKYWKKKGVPYIKPWPIVGNMGPNVFKRQALGDLLLDMYKAFPEQRYVGIYQFLLPTLLVRDLELIKTITVKEFDTFSDHRPITNAQNDPLGNINLFFLTNAEGWHDLRTKLSPAFTSSKMRAMFGLMDKCAEQFVNHLQKHTDTTTVELKDAFSRYTNDLMGTTFFGVTCDSFADPKNEFYTMGKDLTNFSGVRALKFFAASFSPTLTTLLQITFFGKEVGHFFKNLVKETLQIREKNRFVRPDMIHLMMEARKSRLNYEHQTKLVDSGFAVVHESKDGKTKSRQKLEFTDDDITAQAMVFFFAGFDTASTLMCVTTYELAVNTKIQAKLHQEITKHCNKGITYEALVEMNYLDCVISEALRKWPPGHSINRQTTKPFTIEPELPWEKAVHLETGSLVRIPVFAIHRDPDIYPEPDRFDPERFSDSNKHNIKPFSYLPFGAGPRNCIGSRFGLLETKLIIVKLLQKFLLVPVEKTQIPFKMGTNPFNPLPDQGVWIGFKPRLKP